MPNRDGRQRRWASQDWIDDMEREAKYSEDRLVISCNLRPRRSLVERWLGKGERSQGCRGAIESLPAFREPLDAQISFAHHPKTATRQPRGLVRPATSASPGAPRPLSGVPLVPGRIPFQARRN